MFSSAIAVVPCAAPIRRVPHSFGCVPWFFVICIFVCAPCPAQDTAGQAQPQQYRAWKRAQDLCTQPEATLPGQRLRARSSVEQGSAQRVLEGMAAAGKAGVRVRAVEALETDSFEALVAALHDAEPGVHTAAARSLVRTITQANAVDWQRKLCDHVYEVLCTAHTGVIPAAALRELSGVLGPRMRAVLVSDEEPEDRRLCAAYCLGRMRYVPAAEALAAAAWEGDARLAQACVEALAELGAAGDATDWGALTAHPQAGIRLQAVEMLGTLGGPQAYAVLMGIALGEQEGTVEMQRNAVQALAGWPPTQAVPALIDIMSRNPYLRRVTGELLRELTGLEIGDDADAWRHWYSGAPEGESAGVGLAPIGIAPAPNPPVE